MEPKDREKQVFVANLMPARGSWLELEIDKKGKVYVRIDRKRKLPVTVLLRAMGYASDEQILAPLRELALHPQHGRVRHRADPLRGGRARRALQEAAPGRAAERRERARAAQPALLRPQALRPDARRPLQAQLAPRARDRPRHPHADPRRHHRPGPRAGRAAQAPRHAREPARSRSRTTRPRPRACRASRSPTASTSTSTSATAACAPSAS